MINITNVSTPISGLRVPVRTNDFEVTKKDIKKVLRTWHQVSEEHWRGGYSHVAFRDRTGTIRLKDGTIIRWMVKPGGLAMLAFQDGTVLHLAKELVVNDDGMWNVK